MIDLNTLPEPCKQCGYLPLMILWLAKQELDLTAQQLTKLEALLKESGVPKKEDTHEVAG